MQWKVSEFEIRRAKFNTLNDVHKISTVNKNEVKLQAAGARNADITKSGGNRAKSRIFSATYLSGNQGLTLIVESSTYQEEFVIRKPRDSCMEFSLKISVTEKLTILEVAGENFN